MNKILTDLSTQTKFDVIVEALKSLVEDGCSIALAGAHAKGLADSSSDIDLYLFTDTLKSFKERKRIIEEIADTSLPIWISSDSEENPWGKSIDFYFQGTPIEISIRTFSHMNKSVSDSLQGKFDIIPATWTSNGYYTFISLSELSFIKPIWDPQGILKNYQESVSIYPPALKQSIIHRFLGRASTWINNFHYESAINRADLLFTAPIVLHTVLDMIQVIFAVNEVYFTGDKKLEKVLKAMDYCPTLLLDKLEFLLSAPSTPALLQKQYDILKTVYAELVSKSK